MINIILALVILNVLVIAHEFGHYIFARLNKIAVEEFAIGFGPVIWQKKYGETMWSIRLFPLGGFNGLKGEVEAEKGEGNFATAPKKARLAVLFAGSAMNLIVAVIVFYFAIALYGGRISTPIDFQPIGATLTYETDKYPVVAQYVKDSPADKSGLKLPFSILAVNGTEVSEPRDVVELVNSAEQDEIRLRVREQNSDVREVIIVRAADNKLGISLQNAPKVIDYTGSVATKLFSGFSHTLNSIIMTKEMLVIMINASITSRTAEPLGYAIAGPVAIVAVVGEVVDNSQTVIADLLHMGGLIGVSLAIFNLLPFPGLDGWHILLVFYEKARGRRPNEKLVGILSALGFFFLLGLGVLIMIKDVIFFFFK